MFYVLFMCKCVLPPGVNPTAIDKYFNINISLGSLTLPAPAAGDFVELIPLYFTTDESQIMPV
jgi:hypothetical protein